MAAMNTRIPSEHKKLRASSLIEVLTAMVILLVVLTMAAGFTVQLVRSRPDHQLLLQQQLAVLAQQIKQEPLQSRQEFILPGGIRVHLHTEPYRNDSLLTQLELSARHPQAPERLVAHREIILNMPQDEMP